jgi:beta-alanine degradation protein BauB
MMKIFLQYRFYVRAINLSVAFLLTIFASMAIATMQPGFTGGGTSNIPFESMTFEPMGEGNSPKRAIAFGDPNKGAHGFLIQLPAEWASPLHYHSANYNAVVIEGEIINNYEGQTEEVKLTRGGYFSTTNNVNHVTKCLSKTPCIMYVQMDGAFDDPPAWQSDARNS